MKFLSPVLILLMGTACEMRKFEFTLNFQNDEEYMQFREDERFFERSFSITKGEILDELDLSEDVEIKEVFITAVEINWKAAEGNLADGMEITAKVFDIDNKPLIIFNDQSLRLEPFSAGAPIQAAQKITVKELFEQGIKELENNFNRLLLTEFNQSGLGTQAFAIIIDGKNTDLDPGAEFIAADIFVVIYGKLTYDDCLETLFDIGGDPCGS